MGSWHKGPKTHPGTWQSSKLRRDISPLSDEMKKASRQFGWPLHTVGAIAPGF
jgi:hypothetical protein